METSLNTSTVESPDIAGEKREITTIMEIPSPITETVASLPVSDKASKVPLTVISTVAINNFNRSDHLPLKSSMKRDPSTGGKAAEEIAIVRIDSSEFDELMDEQNVSKPRYFQIIMNFFRRHCNYYRLHLLHFVFLSFIGGCLMYATEKSRGVAFIDTYFVSVSAMCVTGLSTVDFSEFTKLGQVIAFFMILLGSAVLYSVIPQIVRWYYYRSYAKVKRLDVTYFRYGAVLEFLAIESLIVLVPFYFLFFQLSAFLSLTIYFAANSYARSILIENKVNFAWFSLFHSVSAFNNAGFGLLSSNLVPFDRDPFVLLVQSVLILAGNTAYPAFLRAMLWCFRKMEKSASAGFEFLWRFPRQSFTHLFTSDETVVLVYIVAALTFGETILSLALDWDKIGRPGTLWIFKIVDGFFQATSTRTAGFQVSDLGPWNPGMLMVSIGAMYLSSYPLTIAIRSTNPLAEEELYDNPDAARLGTIDTKRSKRKQAIKSEAQNLLLHDFTLIFFGMVLILVIESDKILSDDQFNSFKVIFEVISGYGTVGLTMGYPGIPYSFCGKWRTGSKLVLIAVMLLGRHRGLPYSVDKALKVPVQKATTVQQYDDDAVRVRWKSDIPKDFPRHTMSTSLFHTAMFDLDPNHIQKIYTTPNLLSLHFVKSMDSNTASPLQKSFCDVDGFASYKKEENTLNPGDGINIRHVKTAM